MAKNRSLQKKISLTMIMVMIVAVFCVAAVFFLTTKGLSDTALTYSERIGKTTGEKSAISMDELTQKTLMTLAENKADLADTLFAQFEQAVETAAFAAQKIYENPEDYSPRPVPLPDKDNDGSISIQALYLDPETMPDDPAIQEEVMLLGNIQDLLVSLNENFPAMASNYIASANGFMVQADYISPKKYDENGRLMPFDATVRPWYIGAKETGKTFLSPAVRDAHTPQLAVMCGVPIYVDGQFKGVSGAGMYLDDLESMVMGIHLDSNMSAFILSAQGQIQFSTFETGVLMIGEEGDDLRKAEGEEIAKTAEKAVAGESGVELIDVEGKTMYVAYAPMRTVGWSFVILLPQDVVEAPTRELTAGIEEVTEQSAKEMNSYISRSIGIMLFVLVSIILVILLVSLYLSRQIVSPIKQLTEQVHQVEGDKLDFHWDLETGDETQTLAESFESLTERMKNYISDIQTITAERERIGTELELAEKIQASMLPHIFPPFPDRKEFDIYASMDPAKEVGGDFYDFFLVDEDHLGLVMADVSGKGIPAAMLMMITKTIMQSVAMLGKTSGQILGKTNEAICSNNPEGMFVTVWVGILEISTGKLTAANAGHEYPAIKRADGSFEIFKDPHGFVVGGFDDEYYHEYTLELRPGDQIFLYTDGVPEASRENRQMFGMERMLAALNEDKKADCVAVLKNVRRAVDEFVQEAEQFDDLTMMCIEYKGGAKNA
ncbi:MAG: SpoIIE family protein phosphatase [Firmicutes bacterium]|nr:SpoIIE family protein phosphatase [Bacillota bacterium]